MYMWVDRRLLYMLVREGLTETVTFDQSPEKKKWENKPYTMWWNDAPERRPSTKS